MQKLKILIWCLTMGAISNGCNEESPSPSEDRAQLEKLSATWVATEAMKDGFVDSEYDNFRLILSGNPESPAFNYAVLGRPEWSAWPASGTWQFGTQVSSQIIRDRSTADELAITYTLTTSTLTLEFDFAGEGYANGRNKSLEGRWQFTFQKQ